MLDELEFKCYDDQCDSKLPNFFLDLKKSVLEDGLTARLVLEVVA